MSLTGRNSSPFVRTLALGLLAGTLVGTVAEAAPSAGTSTKEPQKLVVYRRATCDKPAFRADACTALLQWLDSWHIKYDVRDVSRVPAYGLTLSQRCLQKHISCNDYPIVDDGHGLLTGTSLANEMSKWAMTADANRVDQEKAQRRDIVPEIIYRDEPSTPLLAPTNTGNENRRRPKATEDDE
jgi:hypothetical protein